MTGREGLVPRADRALWGACGLALFLVIAGFALWLRPGTGEALRLVCIAVAAALFSAVYAVSTVRENRRLRAYLADRESRTRDIHLELSELSSVFEVSSRVNALRNEEEILRFIAHMVRECLDADQSSVFIRNGRGLALRASVGDPPGGSAKGGLGGAIAEWVVEHETPLLLNSRRDIDSFLSDGKRSSVTSALSVPLLLPDRVLGVLEVSRTVEARRFEERHLKVLRIFADYAAHTINNTRMYGAIRKAKDELEKAYREIKVMQDQLVHVEKMSAIGQLISEVSHELNNPLTTTIGYAQLLSRLNDDPEMGKYLEYIEAEGVRCQKIIRNLLDFARKNQGERELVDVNGLIEKTVELRRYQLKIDGVEIELSLDRSIPTFMADASRLQQVILNLVNNAEQAIVAAETGGRIRVETRRLDEGKSVEIRVSDDGPGIPPGLEETVFEPFFTTKPPGQGTGLGLSVCRGILSDLGGRIEAVWSEGGGAEFRIELPTEFARVVRLPAPADESAPVVSGKRILVVDDDRHVRDLLTRTLTMDEHDVLPVESGAEALQELESGGFDLVLSDLRMPGMSGIDLYQAVQEKDERLAGRFVFFTGAAVTDEQARFFEELGKTWLRKPFELDEVRRSIHCALAED